MILQLFENGKIMGSYPLENLSKLVLEGQIIRTRDLFPGYGLDIKIRTRPCSKPKPMMFRYIGQKPGSQTVEILGEVRIGEYMQVPAGTRILHVERVRDEDDTNG